jgi:hypothetical protein
MSKSNDNILGLPPMRPDPNFGLGSSLVPASESPAAWQDIQNIQDRAIQQRVVIDVVAGKSKHGLKSILETDLNATAMFGETTRSIMVMSEEARGCSYESYLNAFYDRMVKTMAQHSFGIVDITAANIAREVMRSPRPPDLPYIPLIKKIFG